MRGCPNSWAPRTTGGQPDGRRTVAGVTPGSSSRVRARLICACRSPRVSRSRPPVSSDTAGARYRPMEPSSLCSSGRLHQEDRGRPRNPLGPSVFYGTVSYLNEKTFPPSRSGHSGSGVSTLSLTTYNQGRLGKAVREHRRLPRHWHLVLGRPRDHRVRGGLSRLG